MTKLRKSVIQITVLYEEGDIPPSQCELVDLVCEMDSGSYLGSAQCMEDVPLSREDAECVAAEMGGDLSFFGDDA